MANEISPREEGKGQQIYTAVISQILEDEQDTGCLPGNMAVLAQPNTHLPRAKSEEGCRPPLVPHSHVVTQGLHTLSSSPSEDPLHPVPHEMALVIVNETSSRVSF